MHYTISYKDGPDKAAKALQDIREYVGEEHWARLGKLFIQPGETINGYGNAKEAVRMIRLALCFAGVHGYPVRAYLQAVFALHPLRWNKRRDE